MWHDAPGARLLPASPQGGPRTSPPARPPARPLPTPTHPLLPPPRQRRIVNCLDIFEIDNNTFATVLDLCEGGDLDSYLKLHEVCEMLEMRAAVWGLLGGRQHRLDSMWTGLPASSCTRCAWVGEPGFALSSL